MDFIQAINSHAEWKIKLRTALIKKSTVDNVDTLTRDDCCAFGKWLKSEGRGQYGASKTFQDCVRAHSDFHRAAGGIARVINEQHFEQAERMLDNASVFAKASNSVVQAIHALKREAAH